MGMLAQRSDVGKRATMCVLPLLKCAHLNSTPTPTKYSGRSSVHILLQPRAFSVLIPPLCEALSFLASRIPSLSSPPVVPPHCPSLSALAHPGCSHIISWP